MGISIEESVRKFHEGRSQNKETMRQGMETIVAQIRTLCGKVDQLLQHVTVRIHEAEEVFCGKSGFELQNDRLAEYKVLKTDTKNKLPRSGDEPIASGDRGKNRASENAREGNTACIFSERSRPNGKNYERQALDRNCEASRAKTRHILSSFAKGHSCAPESKAHSHAIAK